MHLVSLLAAVALVPQPESVVEKGYLVPAGEIVSVTDASLPAEGYRLEIGTNGITIAAADEAGRFYARQTLKQLAETDGKKTSYPAVSIVDRPAFKWRGVHFDDCRHFFGKQTLKRTLDLMAAHKFNVLHWHLTEDQGWRLAIPGYPELEKYAAVRPSSPAHRGTWHKITKPNGETDSAIDQDGLPYGPFCYSEADVKEILAYAAERHILIVPEIELPGHVYAALAAYPEYACCPENLAARHPRVNWGIEKDVLCVGNDRALKFMEDTLDYVCRLFPGPFVHIGGDECPTVRWEKCAKCQARMKAEGLKDVKELQPWVTRRFVKFLESRGKRAVGWDEYLHGDIPASAVGMTWRTGKRGKDGLVRAWDGQVVMSPAEWAAKGHDIVVADNGFGYFYYSQDLKDDPFQYGGGHLPLSKVYAFDPVAGVAPEHRARILGGQCCNWSEYTWNEYDLEWKMWPRGCAMAEVLWCGARKPGYNDFYRRMEARRPKMLRDRVNVAPLPPPPEGYAPVAPGPGRMQKGRKLVWQDEFDGTQLDTNKWHFLNTMNGPDECYVNDARTVRVGGGVLHLETGANADTNRPYLAAEGLATRDRMGFKYGYVEMRAKLPFKRGAWPSLWMQSTPCWREAKYMSEIDIFEVFSSTNALRGNLHKWQWPKHSYHDARRSPIVGEREFVFKDAEKLSDEFHVYGMEWTAEAIRFYIDGKWYVTFSIDGASDYDDREIPGMTGHRDYHFLILNNEIFTPRRYWRPSEWANIVPESLPVVYEVDWIRLWQDASAGESLRKPSAR